MTPDILHTLAAVHAIAVAALTTVAVMMLVRSTPVPRRPHAVAVASDHRPVPTAGGQLVLPLALTQTAGPRRPPRGPRPQRPRRTYHQPPLPGLALTDLMPV
jgi:hypothetical protein